MSSQVQASQFEDAFTLQLAAARAALEFSTAIADSAFAMATSMWSGALGAGAPNQTLDTEAKPHEGPHAQSWYRPPYRSPFDPMFWLSAGHPADMLGVWQNMSFMAWPMVDGARSAGPWEAWANLYRQWPMACDASSFAVKKENSNVINFNSASSAYRTAGGHAVATVVRDHDLSHPAGPSPTLPAVQLWPWPFPLQPLLWPMRS